MTISDRIAQIAKSRMHTRLKDAFENKDCEGIQSAFNDILASIASHTKAYSRTIAFDWLFLSINGEAEAKAQETWNVFMAEARKQMPVFDTINIVMERDKGRITNEINLV